MYSAACQQYCVLCKCSTACYVFNKIVYLALDKCGIAENMCAKAVYIAVFFMLLKTQTEMIC